MQPFNIVCSSCHSRIRIRNPGLLGQQVACPKCKASLRVELPAHLQDVGPIAGQVGNSVDSMALTKEGFPQGYSGSQPQIRKELLVPPTDAEFASVPPESNNNFDAVDFEDVDSVLDDLRHRQTAGHHEYVVSAWDDPSSWQVPEKINPTAGWTASGSGNSRQYLLIASLGLAGLVLSGLLFTLFLNWYGQGSAPNAANPSNDLAVKPAAAEQIGSGDSQTGPSSIRGQDSDPPVTTKTELGATSDIEPGQTPAVIDKPGRPDTVADNGSVAAADPSKVPSESPPASSPLQQGQLPQGTGAQNTLTLGPAMNGTSASESTTSVPSQVLNVNPGVNGTLPKERTTSLSPKLQALKELLGNSTPLSVPDQPFIANDQPPVTPAELGLASADGLVDAPARLSEYSSSRTVRGLNIKQKPISQVVNTWNAVSGISTIVDFGTLAAANINVQRNVDLLIRDAVADDAVKQMAGAFGLQVTALQDRFWLLQAPEPDQALLPDSVKIDDLLSSPQEVQWFQELLAACIPEAVSACDVSGDRLVADPKLMNRRIWFVVVSLLENLRRARSLPMGLSNYSAENVHSQFTVASQVAGLKATINDPQSTAKSLPILLNRLSTNAGINCWVDWASLETLGVTPQKLAVTVSYRRPLLKILEELEFEYGWTTVIIDPQTIWITSNLTYRRSPNLYVLPSQGKDIDKYWVQLFRSLTPIDSAGVNRVVVKATPDGNFIVVKCCPPTLGFFLP